MMEYMHKNVLLPYKRIVVRVRFDLRTVAIRQQARCVVDAQHMMEQQKKEQEAAVALLRKKTKKLEALRRHHQRSRFPRCPGRAAGGNIKRR